MSSNREDDIDKSLSLSYGSSKITHQIIKKNNGTPHTDAVEITLFPLHVLHVMCIKDIVRLIGLMVTNVPSY